jgi:hypothetical protein
MNLLLIERVRIRRHYHAHSMHGDVVTVFSFAFIKTQRTRKPTTVISREQGNASREQGMRFTLGIRRVAADASRGRRAAAWAQAFGRKGLLPLWLPAFAPEPSVRRCAWDTPLPRWKGGWGEINVAFRYRVAPRNCHRPDVPRLAWRGEGRVRGETKITAFSSQTTPPHPVLLPQGGEGTYCLHLCVAGSWVCGGEMRDFSSPFIPLRRGEREGPKTKAASLRIMLAHVKSDLPGENHLEIHHGDGAGQKP